MADTSVQNSIDLDTIAIALDPKRIVSENIPKTSNVSAHTEIIPTQTSQVEKASSLTPPAIKVDTLPNATKNPPGKTSAKKTLAQPKREFSK